MNHPAALPVLVLTASLLVSPVVLAQMRLPVPEVGRPTLLVEGEAANADALRLLLGLAEIRADLQLGLLSVQEGRAGAGAAHFGHARETVLPGLAEGLAAAGVADLGPLIEALETSGGETERKDAYHALESAMLRARASLHPTSDQVLQSVSEMARAAAAKIDASGQTAVPDYQAAWAILMVARGELDLLSRDQDRAVAQLAGKTAMAFDEVILFMPDPMQSGPVAFDRALVQGLLEKLETPDTEA